MRLIQPKTGMQVREPKVNGFYSRHFDNFLEFRRASRSEYESLTTLVLERLPPRAMEILDVGCGDGYIPSLLMERVAANFHLLDQSAIAIERARKQAPGAIEFINQDICEYLAMIPDKTFDVIMALNSLYGATIDREFAENVMGKLCDGGRFMLALATGRSEFVRLQKMHWAEVHGEPFYKKNVFNDALRVFGGEKRFVRMSLETAGLSLEQCERIAAFMLYAEDIADPVREFAKELKEREKIGLEYGFLCARK